MKILPTITSISKKHFQKLKEAEKFGISEICFFPTNLSLDERINFYKALKNSSINEIPFVHLRHDMESWEIDFLIKNYKTKLFNCHPQGIYPFKNDLSPYYNLIYIENATFFPDEIEIKEFAGLCLDFSHLESQFFKDKNKYLRDQKLLKKYPCRCGHISAFYQFFPFLPNFFKQYFSSHKIFFLSDVDYLKKYQNFFPEIMALEVENNLKDQLKIINYLLQKLELQKHKD